MMASPSSTGGLKRCPRSEPQTVWRGADRARRREELVPVALAGVGGGERALHQRAALGERRLVGGADALGGELGVGDDDRLHARRDGRVDDGEDLVAREVAGGEHEVVARDDVDDLEQLRQRLAVCVDHRDGAGLDARRAQLELEAHPHRHVAVRVGVLDLADLVLAS